MKGLGGFVATFWMSVIAAALVVKSLEFLWWQKSLA
jgi:hypothetical protein